MITLAPTPAPTLSRNAKLLVVIVSFAGLLFDGVELGLMPIASLSVSRSLLGPAYTDQIGGTGSRGSRPA